MNYAVALTAYNDELSIAPAINDFKTNSAPIRIIVVDNNCKDKTAEIAAREGAIVVKEERQGYGYACMRGLEEALKSDAEVIILCEGDGTFMAKDVHKFLAYIEDADMVVGTRTCIQLLGKNTQVDWFINLGNKFIARFIQYRWRNQVRLSDVGCTYRAIRRDALAKLLPLLWVGDDTFSPHMLALAIKNGLKVVEIPVNFKKRIGESKGVGNKKPKGLLVGIRMIWRILRT